MRIPLCIICCFSLAAFKIFSLCLGFINLFNICLRIFLSWIYPVWDYLGFLDFSGYFLPHFREIFNYYLLAYFLMPFPFVFFCWDSYDSNVWAFNIVAEVSEIVLICFNSFFFFSSLLHLFPPFFHLTYPLFCLSYSTVVSLQSAFDLSYCIIHYWSTFLYFF